MTTRTLARPRDTAIVPPGVDWVITEKHKQSHGSQRGAAHPMRRGEPILADCDSVGRYDRRAAS